MDERLAQALDFSNYLVTLNNQIYAEKERFFNKIIHYYNGGIFTIDRSLINYLFFLKHQQLSEIVVLDDNNIPIEITDFELFYNEVINKHHSALIEFNNSYKNLRRQRSIENLLK